MKTCIHAKSSEEWSIFFVQTILQLCWTILMQHEQNRASHASWQTKQLIWLNEQQHSQQVQQVHEQQREQRQSLCKISPTRQISDFDTKSDQQSDQKSLQWMFVSVTIRATILNEIHHSSEHLTNHVGIIKHFQSNVQQKHEQSILRQSIGFRSMLLQTLRSLHDEFCSMKSRRHHDDSKSVNVYVERVHSPASMVTMKKSQTSSKISARNNDCFEK